MAKLLLATRNSHKTREISRMLEGCGIEVLSLDAVCGIPAVEEDRPTLEGNAEKKARACAEACGLWSLADDTGLEVAALGGAPGVHSARYAGPGCDYAANNRKLLAALAGRSDRAAAFRCVMALCSPDGRVTLAEGRLDGSISEAPRGTNGFGYDPVFEVPELGKTLAELSEDEKNRLSHRARALERILPHVRKALALLLLCAPAGAVKTDQAPETLWDQIMASQANRGLRVGSRLLEERRFEAAVREFERAVTANPKDPNAHLMLGVGYYWLGQVDRSLESYERGLLLAPDNGQLHMLKGISLAWKGRLTAAYESFKRAAELEPDRADVQMNLGSICDSLGRMLDALTHFRQAATLAPREPLYHFQLGMFYRKLGRDQDAAESLRQALRLEPRFEDALLELGAVDERRGEKKAAAHSFRKAVDLKSKDAVARLRLARLYLLLEETKKARQILEGAFHLTPEEGGAGLKLAVAYSGAKGKAPSPLPGAAGDCAPPSAGQNDPVAVFARNLERVALDQGALMQVDAVFVPRPKLVRAAPEASSLKKALERAIEPARGTQALRREYALRPAKSAEERRAQIARILDDLRAAAALAPEDADVRFGMSLQLTRLADAAGARGEEGGEGAKVAYQPRQVGNDMGLWIVGTGWMALVEEVLPEAGDEPGHPDQSDWWTTTGLGYATLGDGQRALAAFERAVAADAKNDVAHLGRAVAAVMLGREAEAAAALRQALAINPRNKPAKEGLRWLERPAAKDQAAR